MDGVFEDGLAWLRNHSTLGPLTANQAAMVHEARITDLPRCSGATVARAMCAALCDMLHIPRGPYVSPSARASRDMECLVELFTQELRMAPDWLRWTALRCNT